MDYSTIIQALQQASLFDLYRLQVAIGQQLEDPRRLREVSTRLQPGKVITYFDHKENRLIEARVVSLKRTRVLVEHTADGTKWSIPFFWVNLENVDTDISMPAQVGLDRSQLSVGERVGFRDKQNRDVYGEILRLNPKTATIVTDDQGRWRVAYSLLYRVIDGEQASGLGLIEGRFVSGE